MAARYWVGDNGNTDNSAHWSATSGGAGGVSVPGINDDVFFDANSFSGASKVVTLGSSTTQWLIKSLDFTGTTTGTTFAIGTIEGITVYGSITFDANGVYTYDGDWTIADNGNVVGQVITFNGVTLGLADIVNPVYKGAFRVDNTNPDSVCTFVDDVAINNRLLWFLGGGTIDTGGFQFQASGFKISNSIASGLVVTLGSSNIVLNSTGAYALNSGVDVGSANPVTLTANTSTITYRDQVATNLFFSWSGTNITGTLHNVVVDNTNDATSSLTFFHPDTELSLFLLNVNAAPYTVNFDTTNRINLAGFSANGSVGNLITLQGTSNVLAQILITGEVGVSYASINHLAGAGDSPYYDTPGGVDGGNNENWIFTDVTLTRLVPDHGPTSGGTRVTLYGENFQVGATYVKIDTTIIPPVDVIVTEGSLIFTAPAHSEAGAVLVRASTDGVNYSEFTFYQYVASGSYPTYATSMISAIARVEQGLAFPKFIIGGQGLGQASPYQLFKKSSTYGTSYLRSPLYHVGSHFRVTEISIPFAQPIADQMNVVAVLRFDHEQSSSQSDPITSAIYTEGEQYIVLQPENFPDGARGSNNFYVEFQISGPALCTISVPINITIEIETPRLLRGHPIVNRHTFTISSIFEGQTPSGVFGQPGQFLTSIGIDPDVPLSDGEVDYKTAGLLRPVTYEAFSSVAVDAPVIEIITNPKDLLTYVVLSNGKIFSYAFGDDIASETYIGQVADSVARGADYYNNYIYIRTVDDVSAYGPLNGSPSLVDHVWTGATLGAQTALTDTDYPTTLLGLGYLNHYGTVHVDNALYFLDFKDGVGMVHKIKTTKGTFEGDTNDGSAYNILDEPLSDIPMTISRYANDLVVACSFSTQQNTLQGRCSLFFFNPTDTIPSFYREVPLPDAICSALWYVNGTLYGISGDLDGTGYRLWKYLGGDVIQTLKMIEDGYPPLQSAITAVANRIVWGANTTYPIVSSGLLAFGSKSDLFPRGLHNIARSGFAVFSD